MHPPRAEGWYADDLDNLPDAPKHTELIDGVLVFRMPQTVWHSRVVSALITAMSAQAPDDVWVLCGITIRLDDRNRPEPDVVVNTAPVDLNQTWFAPSEVPLVIEVISPESEHRDRTAKFRKYAEAGIKHYWLIDEENDRPVAHVYELDKAAGAYAPTGIVRGKLELVVPFPVTIDLDSLLRQER